MTTYGKRQVTEPERIAAKRLVAGYILEPIDDRSPIPEEERPRLLDAAQIVFDSQPPHQCYWNNRFCVATMCGMAEESQRLAAWCIVSNGLNKYWEWITHSRYLMYDVLDHLGFLNMNNLDFGRDCTDERKMGLRRESFTHSYSYAPRLLLQKIVKQYRLPTVYFYEVRGWGDLAHMSHDLLSMDAQAEREKFNASYPYTKVL